MDAILARRSIRKYTSRPVPDDVVRDLLRAAMSAPSAYNEQPWHFVVIRDREVLDKIPEFHPHTRMLHEAPLAILVCCDQNLKKSDWFWPQDCAAATENILIAVQPKGLGAVWCGVYPRQELMDGMRRLLGLPEQITPFSLVAIGYPAEEKPPADRYDESRVHYDRW